MRAATVRRGAFLAAAAAAAAALVAGGAGLPPFGEFDGVLGETLWAVAPVEREVRNVVTAVLFDYRALDTLGEEFILLAAVAGATLLLRGQREELEEAEEREPAGAAVPPTSAAVRAVSLGTIGATLLVGAWVVLHGHLSPGGGFQGGVVIATAWVLVYLADEVDTFDRVTPVHGIAAVEAAAAGGFALAGAAGLAAGAGFLANVLPLGERGDVLSGGTIPVLNLLVGIEVAAAFVLLFHEFLRQALRIRRGAR